MLSDVISKNGITKEVNNLKRYYREYVRHCLAHYVTTLEVGSSPKFRTAVDKTNWLSCNEVAAKLDPDDLKLLRELYGTGDTIPDKIYQISRSRRTSQSYLWSFVEDIEYKVAKARGLI